MKSFPADRMPCSEIPLVEAELVRLRALDRERQKVADQRLRGTRLSWPLFQFSSTFRRVPR